MTESFFRKISFPSEKKFKAIKKEIEKKNKENFEDGYFKMNWGKSLFSGFQFS